MRNARAFQDIPFPCYNRGSLHRARGPSRSNIAARNVTTCVSPSTALLGSSLSSLRGLTCCLLEERPPTGAVRREPAYGNLSSLRLLAASKTSGAHAPKEHKLANNGHHICRPASMIGCQRISPWPYY